MKAIQLFIQLLLGAGGIWILLYMAGFHIRHRPTPDELFGCKNTYINERGEDTGECR